MNSVLSLDWLGFTFVPDPHLPVEPMLQFINAFPEFRVEEFEIAYLQSHYQHCQYWNDILVSYNDLFDAPCESTFLHKLNMGVNVQCPSHALPVLFNLFGFNDDDYYSLFQLIRDRGCRFSRIDLCFDDFDKVYTAGYYIRKVFKYVDKPCIRSPYINSVTTFGANSKQGQTIYFGSLKKRTKLLRIYDKYAESNGIVDCVRYEFELHGAHACLLAESILDDPVYRYGFPFFDYLKQWIVVLDETSVSRCNEVRNAKEDIDWINSFNSQFNAKILVKSEESKDLELFHLTNYIRRSKKQMAGYCKLFGVQSLIKFIDDAIEHEEISDKYLRYMNKLKHCPELFDDKRYFCDLNVQDYDDLKCWVNPFNDPLSRYQREC